MIDFIQTLIHWVEQHPHEAAVITFLIAFAESLALIGLFFPGSVMLGLIGSLIGAHILSPFPIFLAAVLGAVLGDGLSFWLGYHYHEQIRVLWPFSRFTAFLNKGEAFFKKHGGKSVFLGRFLGPFRPIIPLIAGMMNLQPKRFIIANTLSALLWAPGYLLIGIVVGNQILLVAPHHVGKMISEFVLGVLFFWILYLLLRRQVIKYGGYLNQFLQRWWNTLEDRGFKILLADPQNPTSHRQLWFFSLSLVFGALFIGLFFSLRGGVSFDSLNQPLWQFFHTLYHPVGARIFFGITQLGEKDIILPSVFILGAYLFYRNCRRTAIFWIGLVGVATLLSHFVKHGLGFHRPAGLTELGLGYSFPSGHVLLSLVFWGFLAFILREHASEKSLWRRLAPTVACFIVVIVLFSRLYLGVHWLTDVVGSLLLGSSILLAAILLYRRQGIAEPVPLWPLAIVLCCFILLGGSLYFYFHLQTDLLLIQQAALLSHPI